MIDRVLYYIIIITIIHGVRSASTGIASFHISPPESFNFTQDTLPIITCNPCAPVIK